MKQQKLFLILLFLLTAPTLAQDGANSNVAPANGANQAAPVDQAPPPAEPAQPPAQTDQTNQDPAANPGETAADRFQALREKRLEEAREYQRQEQEREQARLEKLRLEEEARLEAERQKYANEKDSFLSQFKKKDIPTPTPTPSVLDELDQLVGDDEGDVEAEGDPEASETPASAQDAPEAEEFE